jgi:hypothetical protein
MRDFARGREISLQDDFLPQNKDVFLLLPSENIFGVNVAPKVFFVFCMGVETSQFENEG